MLVSYRGYLTMEHRWWYEQVKYRRMHAGNMSK